MPQSHAASSQTHLTTLDADGHHLDVAIHVGWDGIEYVGRLWFTDQSWEDVGFPDRGALPGRTPEEVMVLAAQLRPEDIARRYQRALAEKRRFHGLRRATDDVLAKIRYLNQVALSMRAGLLDAEGAAQEIHLTEVQLHELVGELKVHAGITVEEE